MSRFNFWCGSPEAGDRRKVCRRIDQGGQSHGGRTGLRQLCVFDDLEKPDTVILFEKWKSMAALKSHIEQPYIVSLLKLLGDIGAAPTITLLGPLAGPKSAP